MAEMLKVEYDELMARADELEVPLPPPPQDNPQAPCAITFIVESGMQLAYSADAMRQSIKNAEAEYRLLAESLRNAAQAYEQMDQAAADAINNESATAPASPPPTNGDTPAAKTDEFPPPPETPGFDGYYDLREAIADIEAPDQGTAYTSFEADWNTYVITLQSDSVMRRFRPFEYWEGTSATAVEANFEQQKKYLIQLASNTCYPVARQARSVVEAHKWAITQHPDSYRLYITDFWYDEYGRRGDITRQNEVLTWYDDMQKESEEVLLEYHTRAGLPLPLTYPTNPPAALVINPPREIPDNAGEIIRGAIGGVVDGATGFPNQGQLASQLSDMSVSDAVSNLQGMASAGTGTGDDPYAQTAPPPPLTAVSGPSGKGGVKPASVGGGLPSTPSQGPAGAESATVRGAGAPAGAGAGPGGRPGGAMGGGAGMGGMPMGAGANQGQGQDKKPKRYGEEEDIYTEDRPWTSSVIGVRRRNDAPE